MKALSPLGRIVERLFTGVALVFALSAAVVMALVCPGDADGWSRGEY